MSLSEHEIDDFTSELSGIPSNLKLLLTIDSIEAAFHDTPPTLKHEKIPVQRRWDEL